MESYPRKLGEAVISKILWTIVISVSSLVYLVTISDNVSVKGSLSAPNLGIIKHGVHDK